MRVELVCADISEQDTDAIVNAANGDLMPGSGVNGAIHAGAGIELQDALKKFGGCETGDAVITEGFNLRCGYIIHTVGPVWHGGAIGEEALLARCYQTCLELACQHGLHSISFPAISTGVYGYPPHLAVQVAVREIYAHAKIDRVRFVVFDDRTYELYREELAKWNG